MIGVEFSFLQAGDQIAHKFKDEKDEKEKKKTNKGLEHLMLWERKGGKVNYVFTDFKVNILSFLRGKSGYRHD